MGSFLGITWDDEGRVGLILCWGVWLQKREKTMTELESYVAKHRTRVVSAFLYAGVYMIAVCEDGKVFISDVRDSVDA